MRPAIKYTQATLFSIAFLWLFSSSINAQSIIPWTEQNSTQGLGYPVPIPVDTPEPFDGFRTYAGLFAKHQSMALENQYFTGQIVGQTIYDRDIWAYILSDADNTTLYGVKEGAMMANGGIHAREWQTPETVTGIMELFNEKSQDQSFYQYLLENATIITIPVNNVDGFLQTQRYPTENWYANNTGPRDGRMRRKNMRGVDEILTTQSDHLLGIDLNRNNAPYWAATTQSSNDPTSQVYHGSFEHSEPETLARLNAADLVDADQLRIYTDVHSFSQVHYSKRTFNDNRNALQTRVLADFTNHHKQFPAAKNYVDLRDPAGFGIGTTADYFANIYEIPSWTLETEPTNRFQFDTHPELPGFGADYGGFGTIGNDGFVLPESEIKRVREQLAESFMVAWYGQAGPPSITQLRIIDNTNNAIVFDAEWDITESGNRELYSHYFDEILVDRDYSLLLRFDKPMRYRNEAGAIDNLQGQTITLVPQVRALINDNEIELNLNNQRWVSQNNNGWESYHYYKDDTFVVDFNFDASLLAADATELTWKLLATDMIAQTIDANPATAVTWTGGQWVNYEDSNGNPSINGGFDETIKINISTQEDTNQRMQQPQTALYFDPNRNGEGFNFETLADDRMLLQWYTFDDQGNDQWMLATQAMSAENAVYAPDMLVSSGGVFGADFDPENISFSNNGSVEMIFAAAQSILGPMDQPLWVQQGQMKYTAPDGQKFRTNLEPITLPTGMRSPTDLGLFEPSNELNASSIIGSWFDSSRNGEGFHIQETINGNAVILWYSYDLAGEQKWFIGSNGVVTETPGNVNISFDAVFEVSQGTSFGSAFNANELQLSTWGSIELNLQCTSGTFYFESLNADYGADTYSVVPITRPIVNDYECQQ